MDEDGLDLEIKLLARGEYGAVGDEDVFDDVGIREDDKALVADGERVDGAVGLGPAVQTELRVLL